MTDAASWHADGDALRRWVSGTAGSMTSISVEQHVQRCADCRSAVATLVPAAPLEQVWDNVLADVEMPRLGVVHRLLRTVGVGPSDALVISSAVTLRFAWLCGVIGVLGFAVVAQLLAFDHVLGLFLVAAPLLPVAGVAAAYGPSVDPMYELVQVTPYLMVRLVLLRTASILVTSAPLTVAVGLLMPAPTAVAIIWLLPAAGFLAIVLTGSIWYDPLYLAGVVIVGWITAVIVAARFGHQLAVLAPGALAGYAGIAIVAVAVLLSRVIGSTPSWRLR